MFYHSRAGVGLALGAAVISGVSIFVNKFGVAAGGDPVVYTLAKNGISAAFCIAIMLILARHKELRTLSGPSWLRLLLIGIVGGSVPFVLFFTGLSLTSAVSASFIQKSLFLWVALLAIPVLKERVGMIQGIALALLVAGTGFVGQVTVFGRGELLILIATLLWAVETIIIKQALRDISSWTVAAARMGIGSVVLFMVVAAQGKLGILTGYAPSQWGWTMATGIILFGYVAVWTAALQRAPAVLVASLLVPAAFITSICSALYAGRPLSNAEWWSAAFFIFGCALLILSRRINKYVTYASTQTGHN
jgi:drug/metabolite transporter (DMT)-like permease